MEWQTEQLLEELDVVENIFNEYEHVYNNVLGRGHNNANSAGFWDTQTLTTIQECITRANAHFSQYAPAAPLQLLRPVQNILDNALSTPLHEITAAVIATLPSIAKQLNKETPKVAVNDQGIRIKSPETALFTNIFSHILRNAMDHGIEKPEIRERKSKPPAGNIVISASIQYARFCCTIADDGQGLPVDILFKKGVESGKWPSDGLPSSQTLADLIFDSGVSTKDVITDISGRGVGMDAVKQFLIERGGDIRIELVGTPTETPPIGSGAMMAFQLVIDLPDSICVISNTVMAE